MPSLRLRSLLLAFGVLVSTARAQPLARPDSAFGWLAGTWSGRATVQARSGPMTLFQTEDVRIVAGGHALVIHGLGHPIVEGLPGPTPVFDAAAFLYRTPAGYRMRTMTHEGRGVEAVVTAQPDGLDWGFDTPDGGRVLYRIRRTSDGRWHETGTYTPRGGTAPIPTIELLLSRSPR